ncbi:hypothetical protein [Streptomyces sp. NPDC046862]|uniref:hypothetical protein n=1 Tax=Streptomyces sp. NPDC046862 TaxID=3154603 RepID=UPI003454CB1A
MSDELTTALRELATTHATQPVVGGAEIRGRAMRRRRRRRAAAGLGAGTMVLALLGFALTLHLGADQDHPAGRRGPAAPPSGSASPSAVTPAPVSGTLDPAERTLTFDGRVMPVLSEFDVLVVSTSPLTVVEKQDRKEVTVDVLSKGPAEVDVPYAVELRDGEDQPLHVGTFTAQLKALSGYDVRAGLIALGAEDAKWFYARVHPGDTVSLTTGTTPTVRTPADQAPADQAPTDKTPTATPSEATPSDAAATSDATASDATASDATASDAATSGATASRAAAGDPQASPSEGTRKVTR